MHATYRKIKILPGTADTVGALIKAEYVPLLDLVPGFVSYTLVEIGDDEITSIGVFDNDASAAEANAKAQAWTADRLKPYVASPLEAREGVVLVSYQG